MDQQVAVHTPQHWFRIDGMLAAHRVSEVELERRIVPFDAKLDALGRLYEAGRLQLVEVLVLVPAAGAGRAYSDHRSQSNYNCGSNHLH